MGEMAEASHSVANWPALILMMIQCDRLLVVV